VTAAEARVVDRHLLEREVLVLVQDDAMLVRALLRGQLELPGSRPRAVQADVSPHAALGILVPP
jgi:hypothetical protein